MPRRIRFGSGSAATDEARDPLRLRVNGVNADEREPGLDQSPTSGVVRSNAL